MTTTNTTQGTRWLQVEAVPGIKRRQLAEAISQWLKTPVMYHGTPKFMYQVGEVWIDRNWNIPLPPGRDDLAEAVHIAAARFGAQVTDTDASQGAAGDGDYDATPADTGAHDGQLGLTISLPIPADTAALEANLSALLAAKGDLITRSLGIPATPVTFGEGTVSFPWFQHLPEPEVHEAAVELTSAMVDYATRAARVLSKPAQGGNDKYTMRCFLLRLGFIGVEHKQLRKTLLKRLDGDAAWRNPKE